MRINGMHARRVNGIMPALPALIALLIVSCGGKPTPQQSPTVASPAANPPQTPPDASNLQPAKTPEENHAADTAVSIKPLVVTIPAGTHIRVRVSDTLSTERNHPGDRFTATLDSP